MTSVSHLPVLSDELLALLRPRPGQLAIDCTFGGGGHARLIGQRLGENGHLIAVDRDQQARERFTDFATEVPCQSNFINTPFAEALALVQQQELKADLIYFDLGLSSYQIDVRERGFSYSYDAPLDMRMSQLDDGAITAAEIINSYSEEELTKIFRLYGEERYARLIAKAVARQRTKEKIASTGALVQIIKSALPTPALFASGHPAKRVFQALRIAVNDELGELERALPIAWSLLNSNGRLAVISFHSLEDRATKMFFKDKVNGCICPPDLPICRCGITPTGELISRGAVKPSASELTKNPRARSGRLRVIKKLPNPPQEMEA